jgi:glycerol-3-phosphate dehydrogenase subunit B
VVGGGLAGAAAALELAGRDVEVVSVRAAPGATALGWGTLDLAGASPLRRGGLPLRDPGGALLSPLRRLEQLGLASPGHPYSVMCQTPALAGEAKAAAAALDGWLAPEGLRVRGSVDRTLWLADALGVLRAADLAFSPAGDGDLERAGEMALVDLPGLAGYDARAALRRLAGELAAVGQGGRPLRLVRLALPDELARAGERPARLARALEDPAAQTALRPALAALGAEGRLLLFPPMLGLEQPARVLDWLGEATAGPVAELLGIPGLALAGYRLDRALEAALGRAGVAVRRGRAIAVEASDGRAVAVELAETPDSPAERLPLDALVLATGRFVGGGIGERDGRLVEPLLGLPLHDLAGRRVDGMPPSRLVRRDYEGEQPLFAAGVRTDARLRPLDADGAPRLANLFAAGDLLAGFDPARDRTGLGVALLSGRRAGAEAAAC